MSSKVRVKNKKTPVKKKTKHKVPKREREKASNKYTPSKIEAIVNSGELVKGQSIPFHSIVGHLDLDPYVWITLAKDKDTDREFSITPLRSGLKNISLSNETQKYPKVDFTLYVPDYRSANQGNPTDDNSGRAITELHIGARFYVKWGYASNHTQWGPFRVMERDISFEEGTALLQVTGVMGARLLATSTAEVFSNSSKGTIIDQVASLVDITVDKQGLLQDEIDNFSSDQNTELTTSGKNLGQGLYEVTTKRSIEMHFDPESDILHLSTPFKYELVKRGQIPIRMTYGYPTSNIARKDVETKHPIKKGVSPNFVQTNQQKPSSNFAQTGETIRYAVQGRIPYLDKDNKEQEWIIGAKPHLAWGKWIFPTQDTEDDGITVLPNSSDKGFAQAIKNAEKVWKREEGYKVSATQGGEGADVVHTASWALLIEKEYELQPNTIFEDKFVTFAQYIALSANSSETVTVIKNVNPNEDGNIEVRQYRVIPKQPSVTPPAKKVDDAKTSTTTVQTVVNSDPDVPEGEEVIDKVIPIESASIRTEILNFKGKNLRDKYKKQLKDYEKKTQFYKDVAASDESYKFQETIVGNYTQASMIQVRRDPSKVSDKKKSAGSADTATTDPSKPQTGFKPKSQVSGVGLPNRRITLTTVTIDLKAGDWTMRVGTIIEIVDLHKKINGFYYVFAEEHSIDTNGFHTKIKCKKASQRMVNQYGRRAIGASVMPNPTNSTRKPITAVNVEAIIEKEGKIIEKGTAEIKSRKRRTRNTEILSSMNSLNKRR